MALSAGAVSLALLDRTTGPQVGGAAPAPGLVVRAAVEPEGYQMTVASYDSVIRGLEQALHQRRGQLDTATVGVVEQSLRVIDAALAQAMAALANDPNNRYLNSHLRRTFDRKLDVLRRAASLPVASS